MCKWLDKKVIGFRQNVRSFFTSKTNIASISAIIGAGIAYSQGQMDAPAAVQMVLTGLIGLFLKDAHAGVKA